MTFGKSNENAIWLTRQPRLTALFDNHETAAFIAFGPLRVRLMKPGRDGKGIR